MTDCLLLALSGIAAVAGVIGAIFATWRWDYARRAFELQKKQLYLQICMLAESREYWRLPKMLYVKAKANNEGTQAIDLEIRSILRELKNVK